MGTDSFRTKTVFSKRKNPSNGKKWGIAVDIGYSGTKLYSPNITACFPSFASRVDGSFLSMPKPSPDIIFYRDRVSGETWRVGRIAQNGISTQDADLNSMSIYGRQRYFDPMFLVIARTAIGIACMENEYGAPGDKEVVLQTGLPNSYIKSDRPLIKEVLSGRHIFDLKVGGSEWKSFDISIASENIHVIQQPLGTLLSVSMSDDGNLTDEYESYYNSNVLICDPGFGTMDCFTLKSGVIQNDDVQTMNAYTMKEVLRRTSETIFKKYGEEIPVPSMQKFLEQGFFTKFDRISRKGENIEFNDILNAAAQNVAEEAVEKLCEIYGDLLDYDYMILTGGTGEAWYPYFQEELSGLPNLILVPGNQHAGKIEINGKEESLPFIFSNVRGYYFYVQRM